MNSINFGSNEEFIKNYEELKSSRKMAELYGCNKTTVLNHAKKIGFDPKQINRNYKLSEENKKQIIAEYHTATSTELAQRYNVSRGMITKVWYDANLQGKKISDSKTTAKDDLYGKVINELTVLYPTDKRSISGGIKWMCQCSCGNYAEIDGTRLRSGLAKSCGCLSKKGPEKGSRVKDLTGQRFGKLIAIKQCENKIFTSGAEQVQWLCQCDCGNQTKVLSTNLVTGNTQSCGKCNVNSHGNLKIAQLLTKANIPFVQEKRFKTCKDLMQLPFDFYVNDSYLIEYDGKQHFPGSNGFYEDYENIHRRDTIKSNWCKENNIPLIRIPYTHYDNLDIQDLLIETSSFLEK